MFSPAALTPRAFIFLLAHTNTFCGPLSNRHIRFYHQSNSKESCARPKRRGNTRSHIEPGSQDLLRRFLYCGARAHGNDRRCAFFLSQKFWKQFFIPAKNYSLSPCEEKYGVVSWEFPLVIFWVTAKSAFTCL